MMIAIRPELERKIADKVKSGRYASADDVVANALDVLDRVEAAERPSTTDVSTIVAVGRMPAACAQSVPADVTAGDLWDRINQWRRERHETV